KLAPIGIAISFGNAVNITVVGLADDLLSGIDQHLPAVEQIARVLAQHPTGISASALASELGGDIKPKTVQNHLTALRAQGRANPVGDGSWIPVPSRFPVPDLYGNRESGTVGDDQHDPFRDTHPGTPCPACHSAEWYQAGGGWTCGICHPPVAGCTRSGQ